jgi:hypothetical protein
MDNLYAAASPDLTYGGDGRFYIRLESPALGQNHDAGCVSIGIANVDATSNWPSGITSIADIAAYALSSL